MDTGSSFYIVISEEFAFGLQNKESSVTPGNLFGFAQTTDGRYVCSSNCVNDFPDEFAMLGELTVVPLSPLDFPPTPPIE